MEQKPQYDVRIAPRCYQMLKGHVAFVAQKNPVAADRLRQALIASMLSLREMPGKFPFLEAEEIPYEKYHKMVVDCRYLILYRIRDPIVFVDYVIDGRQDYAHLVR